MTQLSLMWYTMIGICLHLMPHTPFGLYLKLCIGILFVFETFVLAFHLHLRVLKKLIQYLYLNTVSGLLYSYLWLYSAHACLAQSPGKTSVFPTLADQKSSTASTGRSCDGGIIYIYWYQKCKYGILLWCASQSNMVSGQINFFWHYSQQVSSGHRVSNHMIYLYLRCQNQLAKVIPPEG